ncbi:MAG: hypothetical protein VX090_10275, partial [Pseudomonadota bacterium]|nr:hypothetical protein [Pseudomonadota bacterium]
GTRTACASAARFMKLVDDLSQSTHRALDSTVLSAHFHRLTLSRSKTLNLKMARFRVDLRGLKRGALVSDLMGLKVRNVTLALSVFICQIPT